MLLEQEREAEGREKLINSRRLIRDKSDANWLKNDKRICYLLFKQKICVSISISTKKFWLIILYDIKLYDKICISLKILFYSEVNI